MHASSSKKLLAIAAGALAIALLLNVFRRGEDVAQPVTRTLLDVAPSESVSLGYQLVLNRGQELERLVPTGR